MRNYKFIILLVLSNNIFFAQQDKTFNNWYFGSYCGITFNTNPPTALNSSAINTVEGTSSISDSIGNTLFYTDGVLVYTKNHVQMPNGFGLLGHFSSTQSALIVKNPKKNNIYYIFTTDAMGFGGTPCVCLSYSIVDMNLNFGNGDVTSKNVFLYTAASEKIAGYFNKQDSSIWVVSHEYNTNNFMTYKVDSGGVNSTPIVSNCGIGNTYLSGIMSAIGQMKISPDGTKIAYCISNSGMIEIFDFDTLTGHISNAITLPPGSQSLYGLEFAPSSKFLYVTNGSYHNSFLKQYSLLNLSLSAIVSSSIIIATAADNAPFGQLELGPDGKIYVATYYRDINRINSPDIKGIGCSFAYSGIVLPTTTPFGQSICQMGLPNHIAGYYKTIYKPQELVQDEYCSDYIIPNVITPNNDGINDVFKIQCNSNFYVPKDLIIYNRWGEEVFNELKKLDQLENAVDGTYFYVLTFNDTIYKGYLTIFK